MMFPLSLAQGKECDDFEPITGVTLEVDGAGSKLVATLDGIVSSNATLDGSADTQYALSTVPAPRYFCAAALMDHPDALQSYAPRYFCAAAPTDHPDPLQSYAAIAIPRPGLL